MKTKRISLLMAAAGFAGMYLLSGCTKAEKKDDFTQADPPPVGSFTSSDEISPANLVAYFPFDGNVADEKGAVTGGNIVGGGSFVESIKGQAYKGADGAFVSYDNLGAVSSLNSFTIAFWIKTEKHSDGAQGVYMLPRTSDFWGNSFMLIESNNSTEDRMFVKFNYGGRWAEYGGNNRIPNMYGGWRHLAYTYDATSGKFYLYVNGALYQVGAVPVFENNLAGASAPIDASKFIIGGYQQHLGAPWGSADGWMKTFTGAIDEFRIYNKALSAQEARALAKLERQGR